MAYFITGGTGFLGRNLITKLLKREGTIYILCRNEKAQEKLTACMIEWDVPTDRIMPIMGDLTQPRLGLTESTAAALKGKVQHFFHLAAIYDLNATAEAQEAVNIEGTKNAIEAAEALDAGCFHHISSIAAAGLYQGHFREDMFEEAENLDHPYFSTKHLAEKTVREHCAIPIQNLPPGVWWSVIQRQVLPIVSMVRITCSK